MRGNDRTYNIAVPRDQHLRLTRISRDMASNNRSTESILLHSFFLHHWSTTLHIIHTPNHLLSHEFCFFSVLGLIYQMLKAVVGGFPVIDFHLNWQQLVLVYGFTFISDEIDSFLKLLLAIFPIFSPFFHCQSSKLQKKQVIW